MENFDEKLAILRTQTLVQLRRRYAEVFGEATPVTNNKDWLVKRIAWRLQALAEGDLSERAKQRAAELAQDADLRLLPPRRGKDGCFATQPHAQRRKRFLLAPGTILSRTYKGMTVEVKVLGNGFEYQGRIFASLSAVAKDITGSHCSGLRFFGLTPEGGQA